MKRVFYNLMLVFMILFFGTVLMACDINNDVVNQDGQQVQQQSMEDKTDENQDLNNHQDDNDDGVETTILFDKMDLIDIRFQKETKTVDLKNVDYIVVYINYLEENSNKLFSFLLKKAEVTP